MPPPIIPTFRYAIVDDEVYRGAYPKNRNYRFLKRLELKTMLSLIPDPPIPELIEFCQNENIRNIHLQVAKFKDNVPLSYSKAIQAVQILIDPTNHPIFIHCLDGADVTGLVVACLRKLQMWSIPSVMGEFLRYLRGGVISFEESEFIEKFSAEIEIPYTIPSWLWEGKVTFEKHPTLKLKFKDPGMIEQFEQKKQKKKSIEEDVNRKRVGGDLLESFTKVQTKYGESVIEDEETEVSMTLQALALEVFYSILSGILLLHTR
ncbi:hypothetical protein Glove_22g18 [Diversispora epigaea]|uniref:Tyrosine specific protein phosphatases domain-containing protein n=1 Tax=Diversispora epigaea TaxID=1348612 RepID=A0A397JJF5_9GLOM|nr:hypothetical protein Glove_22g18 [Diversispora epigaea]